MAVCSQIHTKHKNTLFGQNVELLNVKLAVHIVTTGPQRGTENLEVLAHGPCAVFTGTEAEHLAFRRRLCSRTGQGGVNSFDSSHSF